MKKILRILFIMVISILFVTGCKDKKSPHIKDISLSKFEDKINNKESFVLYIGNENCSHCTAYMPTLKKVLDKYNIDIYHLDNSKLSEKEYLEFKEYISISGTPTIVFIENGEEETALNRIVGEKSEKETVEIFKVNGYIN